MASASMMTELVKGKTEAEVRAALRALPRFHDRQERLSRRRRRRPGQAHGAVGRARVPDARQMRDAVLAHADGGAGPASSQRIRRRTPRSCPPNSRRQPFPTPDVAASAAAGGALRPSRSRPCARGSWTRSRPSTIRKSRSNIYELGLIYDLDIDANGQCGHQDDPDRARLPGGRHHAPDGPGCRRQGRGLNDIDVDLVWDPPWDKSRMSEAAQLELGMF